AWWVDRLRRLRLPYWTHWALAAVIVLVLQRAALGSSSNTFSALLPHPLIAPGTNATNRTQLTFVDPQDGKTPVASIFGYHMEPQDVRAGGVMFASICWKSLGYTQRSFPYSM